jgi:hypothetical protein
MFIILADVWFAIDRERKGILGKGWVFLLVTNNHLPFSIRMLYLTFVLKVSVWAVHSETYICVLKVGDQITHPIKSP